MIIVGPRKSRHSTAAMALATMLLAAGAGAAVSSGAAASPLPPPAAIPPQLAILENAMAQLRVNSERFSEVTRGFVLGSPNRVSSGRPERLIRTSIDVAALGEAGVSPAEGEVFLGPLRRPTLIAIGSAVYQYEKPAKDSRRHRPWVRSRSSESPAASILPFYGGSPFEVKAGGSGPFARLINLLGAAVGQVGVGGQVSVRGQQTSEFTLTVEPRLQLKGITVEDLANFKQDWPIETLQVFLTPSGLPIRVVAVIKSRDLNYTSTVEIFAINEPVAVKAPPARETIAASQVREHPQSVEVSGSVKAGKPTPEK